MAILGIKIRTLSGALHLVVPDLPTEDWERMKKANGWDEVHLRDNRYNLIIHMVTAASGAEEFYTCAGHKTRSEDIGLAKHLDQITSQVRFVFSV